jgi:hypothetical protein
MKESMKDVIYVIGIIAVTGLILEAILLSGQWKREKIADCITKTGHEMSCRCAFVLQCDTASYLLAK